MNVREIEANVEALMASWSKDTFIYELLLAYGLPKATVTRAMKGTANMSKEPGVVQLKSKVLFKPVKGQDLHVAVEHAAKQATHKERFVIVTDFKTLLAKDMSGKATPLETPFDELHKHYAYFLPWAGLEKTAVVNENPADRKAAEKLARLYDDLREANDVQTDEERHALNAFLTRLLFCFFAEDTGIFEDGQFSVGLGSHTADDGSDSSDYLRRLFRIMGTPEDQRESLPQHLAAFPFVGESLFGDDLPVPDITRKGRSTILAAGDLDWAAINPDIFGSMIQAVVSEENRGELGMHYTSVPNIMKVIGPLFLDELQEEFDKAQGSDTRLRKLLHRIHNLHIFDPACGSGNFLIITYKELRRLEMKILKQFNELPISGIRLDHFHGIEIDDFAHETGKLSMYLAEHQMNTEFEEVMGQASPSLPLIIDADIINGNSVYLDWSECVGRALAGELMVVGNPPYLGSSMQSSVQKDEMTSVFSVFKKPYKNLDYSSIWLFKGSRLARGLNVRVGFVLTSSLFQGENASLIQDIIQFNPGEIFHAHLPFLWGNNAGRNAQVSVSVICIQGLPKVRCSLRNNHGVWSVKEINTYLIEAGPVLFPRLTQAISGLPKMEMGSKPSDGGFLILNVDEVLALTKSGELEGAEKYIFKYMGGSDLTNSRHRYCLVISDEDVDHSKQFPWIERRLEGVCQFRQASSAASTREWALFPNRFRQWQHKDGPALAIPYTTTSRREYLPSYLSDGSVVFSNSIGVVYDAKAWHLALLGSIQHTWWIQMVAGRMKNDYRYSNSICFSHYPLRREFLSRSRIDELTGTAFNILLAREKHPDLTLSQMYDPERMPDVLRKAHRENDELNASIWGVNQSDKRKTQKKMMEAHNSFFKEESHA